jgi:hypothetical protein
MKSLNLENEYVPPKLICKVYLSDKLCKVRSVCATNRLLIDYLDSLSFQLVSGVYTELNSQVLTSLKRKAFNRFYSNWDRANAYSLLFKSLFKDEL